jgi:hypothetical protein
LVLLVLVLERLLELVVVLSLVQRVELGLELELELEVPLLPLSLVGTALPHAGQAVPRFSWR